ncbi:MAG: diaminopimelate decarboxylase [Armatimonadetes bacterium]|nr:diaminopimelate decarboxylase [Armatimonadota bacterium]
MTLFGTQGINAAGHLTIGGCDTVELAERFGTPLYVVDEWLVRDNCRRYLGAFRAVLPEVEIAYAGKALLTTAIARLMDQEGMALDTASAGELYTALQAGFPPERIKLHGNFKKPDLLRMALETGVGRIVVDSLEELHDLSQIAAEMGRTADILIRVAPGIKAHTHHAIQTGQEDTKFGLGLRCGSAREGTRLALELPNLTLHGFHAHIGSQILDTDAFKHATAAMVDFLADMRDEFGFAARQLDLGGGLGIRYQEDDIPPTIEELAQAVGTALKDACAARDFPVPELILEPGRSIVGEAGTTLYTVGVVKHIPGVRTYVSVDGGLSDNPRPVMYDAVYRALLANRANEAPTHELVRISGAHCETDTLIPEIALPEPAPGDILAVLGTGAYNHAMASNYNRFSRPAMVLVADGQADLIYARESLADLVRQDLMPERLA